MLQEPSVTAEFTSTEADPDLVASCVEVAVTVAEPTAAGVKTPDELIVPPVAPQVTAELNAPAPCTVAEQVDVCVVRMELGEQITETDVIEGDVLAVTVADPDLVASCVEVAVMVAVPAALGVNTPEELIVPPVAPQVTAELNAPAPCTVAEQVDVCVVRMELGEQITATEVIEGDALAVTVADPDLVASCVEVAVMVAVPAPAGVKTPDELIVPPVAPQVTAELNAPAPCTVAEQVDVCVVRMELGEQITETDVIEGDVLAVTVADPDLVASCIEVAVMVAVPAPAGVKTPDELIVPPVAPQVTAELNAPAPCTVAEQLDVCVVRMELGEQITETDVIEADVLAVTVADPDLVASCVDVAVMVVVPAVVGVKTPDELIVPPVALQVTAELNAPAPCTVAEQVDVCVVRTELGEQITATDVIEGDVLAVTVADPDLVASCVEVAVIVAAPAADGVKTPDELIVPPVAPQVTAELNAPAPCTIAEQVDVCVVRIELGEQITETDAIKEDVLTITVVDPDLVASCIDVAVMVAGPAAAGVKTPDESIVPPVAAQVKAELNAPDPCTLAQQVVVCVVRIALAEQVTETVAIDGEVLTITVAEPDLVASCIEVAVMVAEPAVAGVKAPDELIAPFVADQVTPEL
jgi:hypothetical protein